MKNLKNMVAALSLTAVMGFGAVSTNAGILMSDRAANNQAPCGTSKTGYFTQLEGIIITGSSMLDGIIIIGREGILLGDRKACESKKDGILMSDSGGILMSDAEGILLGD